MYPLGQVLAPWISVSLSGVESTIQWREVVTCNNPPYTLFLFEMSRFLSQVKGWRGGS
jgi:hypothetical protein